MSTHYEYREGEWTLPSRDPEPNAEDEAPAYVVFCSEPSPETGHVGWCWWALGHMGDAPTLDEAKAAAERALARFVEERSR